MVLKISPLPSLNIGNADYDAALAMIGYEARSRHFFTRFQNKIPPVATALAFSEQRIIAYSDNEEFFGDSNFLTKSASVATIEDWTRRVCSIRKEQGPTLVVIDISAMTRQLIASVCFFLMRESHKARVEVQAHFVYSPAEFGDIPATFGPIVFNGPAIESLAGWSESPGLPCGVVLGIGYEEDLALGTIEELEAARVWGFRPSGHDPRYDAAIDEKNRGLFEEIPPTNLVRYSLQDPYSIFSSVETVMALSKNEYRIITVPFGPKIFALASCLAVLYHYPQVGFWRVSGGANVPAVDRIAAGKILGLSAVFGFA